MNHLGGKGCLAVIAFALALGAGVAGADDQGPDSSIDCGPSALYHLARLLGRPLALEAIRSNLPATRQGNFSMEELNRSALACGLSLRGVLLAKGEAGAIDRPMLVFLNRGEHGHFLVVRPVGTSGRLVQVVDSANPPAVIDKSTLLAAKSWTGLALIRDDSRPWAGPVRIFAGITLAVVVLLMAKRAWSWRHPGQAHGLHSSASLGV